jgi:protein-disulfide isomerase
MEGEKVLVVKFNDYVCPACGQSYRDYKPIIAKYQASNPGALRVVTKDYPLDPECNFNTPGGPHQAACEAAAAVRMAEAKGKKDALVEWLYSNQSSLTPQSVKEAAATIAGVTDFDAQYPHMLIAIKGDVAAGGAVNVRSTPTFIINGRLISGALPAQYFDQAIALELKRAGVSK